MKNLNFVTRLVCSLLLKFVITIQGPMSRSQQGEQWCCLTFFYLYHELKVDIYLPYLIMIQPTSQDPWTMFITTEQYYWKIQFNTRVQWQGQFPLPDRGPTNLIEWLICISFWNWYCRIIQNKWYTMCTASFVDCLQSTSRWIWADTVCLSPHEGRKHSRRHVFSYADARFSSQAARWRVGHRGIRLSAARLTTTV